MKLQQLIINVHFNQLHWSCNTFNNNLCVFQVDGASAGPPPMKSDDITRIPTVQVTQDQVGELNLNFTQPVYNYVCKVHSLTYIVIQGSWSQTNFILDINDFSPLSRLLLSSFNCFQIQSFSALCAGRTSL
jgi:hypothetical protein